MPKKYAKKARFLSTIPASERYPSGPTRRAFKWLSTPGLHALLLKPIQNGLKYMNHPPSKKPRNGDVFLYDKQLVKNYRQDGLTIERKATGKGTAFVESHRVLKIQKVQRIHCAYSRGAGSDILYIRRMYWLCGEDKGTNSNVVVHYRTCNDKEQQQKRQTTNDNIKLKKIKNRNKATNETNETNADDTFSSGLPRVDSSELFSMLLNDDQKQSSSTNKDVTNNNQDDDDPLLDAFDLENYFDGTDDYSVSGTSSFIPPSNNRLTSFELIVPNDATDMKQSHEQNDMNEDDVLNRSMENMMDLDTDGISGVGMDSMGGMGGMGGIGDIGGIGGNLFTASSCMEVVDYAPSNGKHGDKIIIVLKNIDTYGINLFCHFECTSNSKNSNNGVQPQKIKVQCESIAPGVVRVTVPLLIAFNAEATFTGHSSTIEIYVSNENETLRTYNCPFEYTTAPGSSGSSGSSQIQSSISFSTNTSNYSSSSSTSSTSFSSTSATSTSATPTPTPTPTSFSSSSSSSTSSNLNAYHKRLRSPKQSSKHRPRNGTKDRNARFTSSNALHMPTLSLAEQQHLLPEVDVTGREFKIRIVERMSALANSPAMNINSNGGGNFITSRKGGSVNNGDDSSATSPTATKEEEALLNVGDEELLNASDEDLNTMSMQAAEQLVHALTRMADANEDDDLRQELWMLDDNGFSFLHYICMYGYTSLIPVVLDCIRRGKNGIASLRNAVNTPTSNGVYPIHFGVSSGSVEMVRYLMIAGADSQQVDVNGKIPASYTDNNEIVDLLLYEYSTVGDNTNAGGRNRLSPNNNGNSNNSKSGRYSGPSSPEQHLDFTDTNMSIRRDGTQSPIRSTTGSPISLNGSPVSHHQFGSSPSIGPIQNADDTIQRELLLGAFKTLSIHDRVALSIGLGQHPSQNNTNRGDQLNTNATTNQHHTHDNRSETNADHLRTTQRPGSPISYSSDHQMLHNDSEYVMQQMSDSGNEMYYRSGNMGGDSGSEFFSDSASMISDIDVVEALQLDGKTIAGQMNEEEQDALREQVSMIQSNVKAWLVRRNFKNMCNATHLLQRSLRGKLARRDLQRLKTATKTIESRRLAALTRRRFVSMGKAVTALQAANRGIAQRRQFKEIRKQASAALILNRNIGVSGNMSVPKSPPPGQVQQSFAEIMAEKALMVVEEESEEDEDL